MDTKSEDLPLAAFRAKRQKAQKEDVRLGIEPSLPED
jgi:hypothetical protein